MIDVTLEKIRAFRRAAGWTKSRLAAEAGLNESVLRFLDRPHWNPTIDTVARLEAVVVKATANG
jgi:ribosome-binding protein aMBF1 (putative translation factor)